MSLGSRVVRLISALVLFIILGLAGWVSFVFAVLPIGMSAGSCANGASSATNLYTNFLGIMFALGSIIPPALIVFSKRWWWSIAALIICAVLNIVLFSAQFWLPFNYCK